MYTFLVLSQPHQVCYILLDSILILAERYLRTLQLKIIAFSWVWEVSLIEDAFPHLSAMPCATFSIDSVSFCRLVVVEVQLVCEREKAVL